MRYILIFSLFLFSFFSQAQIKGIVKDSLTGKPIPYVNIWVEGESVGTSTSEDGSFSLGYGGGTLVFSCIGYKSKVVEIQQNLTVFLSPNTTILEGFTVKKRKSSNKKIVSEADTKKTRTYFGNKGTPNILARYYQYKPEYDKTPFIEKVSFYTRSNNSVSKISIRLMKPSPDGTQTIDLWQKSFIVETKAGKRLNEINFSDLNIPFPKEGLLVGFEWIIIPENQYKFKYKVMSSSEKVVEIKYNPDIIIYGLNEEHNAVTWTYSRGRWNPFTKKGETKSAIGIVMGLVLSE